MMSCYSITTTGRVAVDVSIDIDISIEISIDIAIILAISIAVSISVVISIAIFIVIYVADVISIFTDKFFQCPNLYNDSRFGSVDMFNCFAIRRNSVCHIIEGGHQ